MHQLITPDGIDLAYRQILGRPVDSAGLAHFQAVTAPYRLTLGRLIYILAGSEEFSARPAEARDAAMKFMRETAHPAESVHWYHSIRLPDGYITNGAETEGSDDPAELVFKHSIAGKSVLDIGAWDGLFSFHAEKNGAADVLATDWYCWEGPGWGTKEGFEFARRTLRSRVRDLSVDLFSLDPSVHGRFDVVLLLGVLYHVEDPLGGLKRAAAMCADHLIVSSATRNDEDSRPLMEYAEGHHGDDTTYWLPNTACQIAILQKAGFGRFEIVPSNSTPASPRHIIHAWRA